MQNTIYKKVYYSAQDENEPKLCIYLTLENNGCIVWLETEHEGIEILTHFPLEKQYSAIDWVVHLSQRPADYVLAQPRNYLMR